ncbi:NYN domain-containing protein [Mameliella sp.]|uniref:NYN domain-containing protein n=1 Tax=Mameliella sp. TaxID=1924940 RepID=UPI003BA91320
MYVDGFNLYHAIDDLGDDSLKWFDLWGFSKSLLRRDEFLDKVSFFTAVLSWDKAKRLRHSAYVSALSAKGVNVVNSNFKKQQKYCFEQDRYCKFREEKKTDVAIGVSIVADAMSGRFSRAVLITADSDQIPAVEVARAENPEAEFSLVLPPGRKGMARGLSSLFDVKGREITADRMRRHLMPRNVYDASGQLAATRPSNYAK